MRLPSNVSGFYELMSYCNEVTNNWFATMILFMIFIFLTITTYSRFGSKALVSGLAITTLIAFIMRAAGLVSGFIVSIFFIGFIASIIYSLKK